MAKTKDFKQAAAVGAQKFFTDAQKEKEEKAAENKNEFYRINLKLPAELGEFIDDEHWRLRLSRNDVIKCIIEGYKEALEAQGKDA